VGTRRVEWRWLLVCLVVAWSAWGTSRTPGQSAEPVVVEPKESPDLAPHVADRLLVKFSESTDKLLQDDINAELGAGVMLQFPNAPGLVLVGLPKGTDTAAAIQAYEKHPQVEYAEPDYIRTLEACPASGCRTPNDPRFSDQWGLHNTGQPITDPVGFVCLGGPDSGMACTNSSQCRKSCSDNGAVCLTDTDCDGTCSLDDAPCNYDWQCNDHCSNNFAVCDDAFDCGGGRCSDNQAPCTYDWNCQKKCSNNQAPCTYDWQCGDRLCQGGVDNGQVCTSDMDCNDRLCQGGANPGSTCTSDSQCGKECIGGFDHGDTCSTSLECRGMCDGGQFHGSACSMDSQCGGRTCQGGTNPGVLCSSDLGCGPGGHCVLATCEPGTCTSGTCSPPGVCGPQPVCVQPTCQTPVCMQSVCENPTCVSYSCGSPAGLNDFDIDAPEAWYSHQSSPNVVIASLDSGVKLSHEDMSPAWVNPGEIANNGLDDDHNGHIDDVNGWDFYNNDKDPADDHWHGTFTMGIAAARGNNGLGISGVTWLARIMPLKVCGDAGCPTSFCVAAIDYAVQEGADVINVSLGGGAYSQSEKDAIDRANAAGVLLVASAGNSGSNNDLSPTYPASYTSPNIISVAAMNRIGLMSSFSNYGAASVDLGAPGENILSTTTALQKYGFADGTSFAAPFVTGAVAYLYGYNPSLTHTQVKQILLNSVVPDDSLRGRSVSGGMLNLRNALTQTPACVPTTCSAQGKNCGTIPNGCGGTLSCGTCSGNSTCQDNVCVCTPTTCAAQGKNCGTISNGCGGTLSCGTCPSGTSCSNNVCVCAPTTCNGRCGTVSNGCGGWLSCGTCGSGSGSCRRDFEAQVASSFGADYGAGLYDFQRCLFGQGFSAFTLGDTMDLGPSKGLDPEERVFYIEQEGEVPGARWLTILNGAGKERRLGSARILVNDVVVLDVTDITADTSWVDKPITLEPGSNRVVVQSFSEKEGTLSLFATEERLLE
jgi:subtilisin family serine protease